MQCLRPRELLPHYSCVFVKLPVSGTVDYDKATHPIGEGLFGEVRVNRVKVVSAILKAGFPLSKLDTFRELLKENAYRLSDSTNLYSLIPFIHQQPVSRMTFMFL